MANYLVDSTDLTSVADAIRTKGGTSAQLAFPAGFVSAVEAIETGGGGYTADDIAQAKAPAGAIVLNVPYVKGYGQDGIRDYAFYGNTTITSIVINTYPNIYSYAFAKMTALRSFSAPLCEIIGNVGFSSTTYVFQGCTNLTSVNIPEVTSLGGYAFQGCTSLPVIVMPKAGSLNANNIFEGCTALVAADFGSTITKLGNTNIFKNCSSLNTLIIRSASVCPLSNITNVAGTPFASGGSGGTIYIPKALYDHLGDGSSLDYKAATNWSTVDGYGTITWAQIEGSIYETQYADGTPIT